MAKSVNEVKTWKSYKWSEYGYKRVCWKDFDYTLLTKYLSKTTNHRKGTFMDAVTMFDTETSKSYDPDDIDNHVVCWSHTIGAYNRPVVTIVGRTPSEFCLHIKKMLDARPGEKLVVYVHNLAYDWVFMRGFFFKFFKFPLQILATKPHYPIYIEFENGLILRDSLILSQCSLEKWADNMDVPDKKAVGLWDYDKYRDQGTPLSDDEWEYVEHDTLAGVECLIALKKVLRSKIYAMPYTATGINRKECRIRGKKKDAHDFFLKQALTWEQQITCELVYHGGFTHGNRHYIGVVNENVQGGDFQSSYPFIMCAYKVPGEKFAKYHNCMAAEILKQMDDYAFMTKLILRNVKVKYEIDMPIIQYSKAVKTVNAVCDNGRIIWADYVEIYVSEYTLDLIMKQYEIGAHACVEVQCAAKKYLPRWFTDYVFECYTDKCALKYRDPYDAVLYALSKSRVNSLYGLTVMHPVRDEIQEVYSGEDTGTYTVEVGDFETKYNEYVNLMSSIFCYQWGAWITEIAQYNLFKMGAMCDTWLYSDTDSVYGQGWHMDQVEAYNQDCLQRLRANGYDAVRVDGHEFILGTITFDKDSYYDTFKYLGAKRYAGRNHYDHRLHITVAGVPKKTGVACLHDNLDNFTTGFIFDGITTGKLTHTYNFCPEGIHIDEHGNEICDSINLTPCDYRLDSVYVEDIEDLEFEEVNIQIYE